MVDDFILKQGWSLLSARSVLVLDLLLANCMVQSRATMPQRKRMLTRTMKTRTVREMETREAEVQRVMKMFNIA